MSNSFSLLFERGLGVPTVVDLTDDSLLIGSSTVCDVTIADRYVSRRHAELCVNGNGIEIRDLESRNGTTINGERLFAAPVNLRSGDCVELAAGRVVARIISSYETETLPAGTVIGTRPDSLSVDSDNRTVTFDGSVIPLELSPRQWALLLRLYATKGRPVSVSVLKQAGWPRTPRTAVSDVSLRTQLSRVRRVLRAATAGEVTVAYVQGAGYLLS